MHRFEQLHERGLAIFSRNGALAITGHDLPQQSDLLHAAPGQLSAFGNNVSNGAASLFPARIWDNAKCAVLVAALHDADKSSDGLVSVTVEQVFANRAFAPLLFRDIDNLFTPAGKNVVQVIGGAMEFLRAQDEIYV